MSNPTLSPRQAAHALGIRLDSLYALLWAGKITAEKRDGRWRVCAESVDRRRAQRSSYL
jgi:predicted site-specific integrase-resolvase